MNAVQPDCTAGHKQPENNDANSSSEESDDDILIVNEIHEEYEEEEYLEEPFLKTKVCDVCLLGSAYEAITSK